MNLPDSGSDLEESQATQVLQGLLDLGVDSWTPKSSRRVTREDDPSISKDISSDSSPPRNTNNALPVYHFHGLASTQTQTQQHDEEIQPDEGSQKENIKTNKGSRGETLDAIDTRSSQASSSKPSRRRSPNEEQGAQLLSRVTKPKPANGKAVSFQSPRTSKPATVAVARATTAASSTRFTPYHPPRAPIVPRTEVGQSSQDSFAGGFSQDPEQAFLAASKQFEIPLSELERDIDSTNGVMSNYPSSGRSRRFSPPSEGRVLVAATPSNSGSSQSQPSQPLDESQSVFVNRHPDYTDMAVDGDGDASQQSTQESQISSSYERYINGEPEEPIPLPELQATQPSTQPDEDLTEEDEESHQHGNSGHTDGNQFSGDSNANHSATTSTIPQSRNLLSLVNPKNKWRYQQYQGQTPGPADLHGHTLNVNLPSNSGGITEETQPSLEDGSGANTSRSNILHLPIANIEETQPSIEDEESALRPQRRFPNPPLRRHNLGNVMQQIQPSLEGEESAKLPQQQYPGALAYRADIDNVLEGTQPSLEDEDSTARQVADALFPNNNRKVVEETQPSFDDDHSAAPLRRRFPKAGGYSTPPVKPSSKGGISDDPMDIVPDSEPLRDESGESSKRSQSPTKSPVKRVFRRISHSLDPDLNSGEIVLKSPGPNDTDNGATDTEDRVRNAQIGRKIVHQDDDDEEDIPLAAKPKSNTRVTSRTTASKRDDKGKAREILGTSDNSERPAKSRKLGPGETPVGGGKGKQKQKNPVVNPQPAPRDPSPNARKARDVPSVPAAKPPATGHSWETGVVPSSAPEQDLVDEGPSRAKPTRGRGRGGGRGRGRGRGGASATSRSSAAKPASSTSRPRRRTVINSYAESSDEETKDELLPISNTGHDDDDNKTEPIDGEYEEPSVASSSLKRKRVALSSANPVMKPKSNKTATLPIITPTIQNKRLRSVPSSNRGTSSKPTRVFAEWNPDHNYYPGVVHSHVSGSSYSIKFDDNDKDTVDIEKMRAYDLRVGDEVIYQQAGIRSSTVIHVDKLLDNVVSIELNGEIKEVAVKKLKISHKAIKYAWDDRRISPDTVITVLKNPQSKLKPNPTPPKASFSSEASSSAAPRNFLSKTGIAVTTGTMGKSGITTKIRNSGGTIIDDWGTIIRMEGKHTHSNNRWVIEKKEVVLSEDVDLERVFLVADAPNQKAKFLIALALGIPCLSLQWVDDSVKLGTEQPWANYMLAQGFSKTLNARPSQQVDVEWGTSVHHLREIVENAVPCKLFNNLSILCIGTELVPQPKGKTLPNTDGGMQDAHNAVVRIIMSMGAQRVEAVSHLRYASAKPKTFDLVVIKELPFCNDFDPGNTVPWQWVKDSLIASRRVPVTPWEVAEAGEEEEEFIQSQET